MTYTAVQGLMSYRFSVTVKAARIPEEAQRAVYAPEIQRSGRDGCPAALGDDTGPETRILKQVEIEDAGWLPA